MWKNITVFVETLNTITTLTFSNNISVILLLIPNTGIMAGVGVIRHDLYKPFV